MTNLPAKLSTLQQEIGALTEQLAPVEPDFIAKALDALKRGGMSVPSGIAPADFIREYSIALTGVPVCGLKTAVAKLKRGQYESVNPGFMPTPAELAAICRLEARPVLEDRIRKRETLETLRPAEKQVDRSPAVMARVRAKLGNFRQEHAAQKIGGAIPQEPVSPERAAELAKMLALPDAREVSAEQMAYRRKIEMDIDASETPTEEKAA